MTNRSPQVLGKLRRLAQQVQHAYAGGQDRPLLGYTVAITSYTGLFGLLAAVGRARGARLPERFDVQDVLMLCAATHKASRLLTKEAVTSPLRAPFTRYEEPTGGAELRESVRGTGVRHAVGELVTCPFCLGVWIASGLTAGLVLAPRATRVVITALTAIAASDALQLAYDGAKQRI